MLKNNLQLKTHFNSVPIMLKDNLLVLQFLVFSIML